MGSFTEIHHYSANKQINMSKNSLAEVKMFWNNSSALQKCLLSQVKGGFLLWKGTSSDVYLREKNNPPMSQFAQATDNEPLEAFKIHL